MGFDGMDPTLARQFMDAGKLPNLKRLAASGSFAKLENPALGIARRLAELNHRRESWEARHLRLSHP